MKKILLVSGDSFTDPDWWSEFHPEMETEWPKWPEILAKKLDMECVNLGKSGSGQEFIYTSLLEYITNPNKDINRIGLVVPAWSQCQRKDYQKGWGGRWTNRRLDIDGDIFGWINRSLKYMLSLQVLCERYNLPYKQFQMINLFNDYLYGLKPGDSEVKSGKYPLDFRTKYPGNIQKDKQKILQIISNYEERINTKNFIGWPMINELGGYAFSHHVLREQKYKVSELDSHPNKEGQEKIAEFLYDRLG
tara:strand:- start:28 stop:771 length:744 start_codon:yes stop_codon:yes gene_type:complete